MQLILYWMCTHVYVHILYKTLQVLCKGLWIYIKLSKIYINNFAFFDWVKAKILSDFNIYIITKKKKNKLNPINLYAKLIFGMENKQIRKLYSVATESYTHRRYP